MSPTDRADALRIGAGQAVPGHVHGTEDVVADHGLLLGLGDDDHAQYLNRTGVRPMTGNLAMGSNKITGLANGVADTDAAAYGQFKALLTAAVTAGNGMTGGGALPSTLNVVAGHMLEAGADAVGLLPWCTTITDWNAAVYNGWYMASGAANSPVASGGWWYGFTIGHNGSWCHQIAFPFANSYSPLVCMVRSLGNGTWTGWTRLQNYVHSWDVGDAFIFFKHGGDWSASTNGATRWAIGNKKDASAAPSSGDTWRIQRYDTAGNYTGNLMTGTQAGAVNFPGGHTLLMNAMAGQTAVEADRAATVGIVEQMILIALDNNGLLKPQAMALNQESPITGLKITDPTPDYDPADSEEPTPPPAPQIDPNSLG